MLAPYPYAPAARRGGVLLVLLISLTVLAIIGGILLRYAPDRMDEGHDRQQRGAITALQRGKLTKRRAPDAPVAPGGEHTILGAPTITAEQIDALLTAYGSPAAGTGHVWMERGKQYNINPAYALAFFIHESRAATAPQWAGWKGGGSSTHNVGNIICAGYATCFGRFRDYPDWRAGINDWYRLIAVEYVEGRGVSTIEQIIPIYAPAFENNVGAYVGVVTKLVKEWQHDRTVRPSTLSPPTRAESSATVPITNTADGVTLRAMGISTDGDARVLHLRLISAQSAQLAGDALTVADTAGHVTPLPAGWKTPLAAGVPLALDVRVARPAPGALIIWLRLPGATPVSITIPPEQS